MVSRSSLSPAQHASPLCILPPPYTYSTSGVSWEGGSHPLTINSNTHTAAGHVWYIKLPMYLFFIWSLFGLNNGYSGLHPLLGPLDGVGPENLHFFGPKWHLLSLWPFQGPKKSQFSGTTPSNGSQNGCSLHTNNFIPPHINNWYINSYSLPEVWSYKSSGPSVCRSSSCTAGRRRLKTEKRR